MHLGDHLLRVILSSVHQIINLIQGCPQCRICSFHLSDQLLRDFLVVRTALVGVRAVEDFGGELDLDVADILNKSFLFLGHVACIYRPIIVLVQVQKLILYLIDDPFAFRFKLFLQFHVGVIYTERE